LFTEHVVVVPDQLPDISTIDGVQFDEPRLSELVQLLSETRPR
jgi:hypothetical protein